MIISKMFQFARSVRSQVVSCFDEPALILIYHRVTRLESDPQMLAVSPDNFYNQVKYLKENYNLLNIDQFVDIKKNGGEFPKRSIMLTFDDGYADNYKEALPILEKLRVQAVFYVSTGNIDTKKEFWWDELERIFLKGNPLPKVLKFDAGNTHIFFPTSTKKEKDQTYHKLHPILRDLKGKERDKTIAAIIEWANLTKIGRKEYRSLSSKEVKLMSLSKFAVIGAHTRSHAPLSIYSYDEQFKDIKDSKEDIERIIGKEVRHFSYPFGCRADYNRDTISICEKLNFDFVPANYFGQIHRWTNRYELPRILIRNWELELFKDNINRFYKS